MSMFEDRLIEVICWAEDEDVARCAYRLYEYFTPAAWVREFDEIRDACPLHEPERGKPL